MNLIGYDMILFGSDMILCGYYMVSFVSIFKLQELSFMLVVVLINFGVKNQVPKVSFKITTGDLMSILSHQFDDIIFYELF